jgi:CDP-diacylglycerol--serine O-phosphatidyltransferase
VIARFAGQRRRSAGTDRDGNGRKALDGSTTFGHALAPRVATLPPKPAVPAPVSPAGPYLPVPATATSQRDPAPVTTQRDPATVTTQREPATVIPLLPGERTTARRVKFAIANGCTVSSLVLGLVAVFLGMAGDFRLAALALLACVVFDGCDGGLARRFNVASPFGAQLDSLADLSSFGVATGIVLYRWMLSHGAPDYTAGPVCAIVTVCAAIRLARFNVSPKNGTYFCGVPTTMVSAVLALNILLGPNVRAVPAQLAFVAVYALSMVTPFPYLKLGRVLRLPLWVWVVPAICAMISVWGTFLGIVCVYLVSGPVLWLVRRRANARPAVARSMTVPPSPAQ